MSLTILFRPPVVWFVAAEMALIAILGAIAWHVWLERVAPVTAAAGGQMAAAPPVAPPRPAPGRRSPAAPAAAPSALPSPRAPAVGPTPGIRTDAEFLSHQVTELNRVEATFEDLEWRVTKAIVDAIQRYLDGVVLPSIDRSERGQR